jgi:hypothetical protein
MPDFSGSGSAAPTFEFSGIMDFLWIIRDGPPGGADPVEEGITGE